MYRAGVEWILGFRLRGSTLQLDPCIPRDWSGYEVSFRYHSSRYEIEVRNPSGVMRGVREVQVDGKDLRWRESEEGSDPVGAVIPLWDDGRTHQVRVVLG
jgi:cyclic beta-1,2-glucan synthetase